MELKPVTFHYKQDPQGDLQYGLLAEDVAQVYPELAVKDEQGQIQAIRYQELTPMLLNELQKEQRQFQAQQQEIHTMQQQLHEAQTQLRELQELKAAMQEQNARLAQRDAQSMAASR
jgi:hypothetical protein